MTETRPNSKNMTCAEFQEHLPELFETHADLSTEEHLQTCENCKALVRDLEYIAATAKSLFEPTEEPSDAIWGNIQSKLQQEPIATDLPNDLSK